MTVPVKMEKWTIDEVVEWLQTTIKLSTQQAEVFKDESIDGSILLDFTEERLKDVPFCLKTGPRMHIMRCINQFKDASGKGSVSFWLNRIAMLSGCTTLGLQGLASSQP